MTTRTLVAPALAAMLVAISIGCAHRPAGRRAESRMLVDTVRTLPAPAPTPVPTDRAQRTAVVRDTAYVAGVLRRCGARTLLPDQESIRDTLLGMLAEVRAALSSGDLERARAGARNARQLATSLRCL